MRASASASAAALAGRVAPVAAAVGCGLGCARVASGGPGAAAQACAAGDAAPGRRGAGIGASAGSAGGASSAAGGGRASASSPGIGRPYSRRMRSASGGCVAHQAQRAWLTRNRCASGPVRADSAAACARCCPAILRSAPPRPSTCRVYLTAEASARNSRWRDTAACSSRPAAQPSAPTAISATPNSTPKRWRLPAPGAASRRPRSNSSRRPQTMPISRMFKLVSPCTRWLSSCATTPCSSLRSSRSSAPRVTATTASSALQPAAKALIASSRGSTQAVGARVLAASAISVTTWVSRRSRGSSRPASRPPASRATCAPPSRRRSDSTAWPPSTYSSSSAVLVVKNQSG